MKSSDIEQADRRKLVGSTTSATTYREIAEAGITLQNQGRFGDKASVVGSARVPQYPAAAGPWNDPVQVPPEPPLGYEINAQEVVGEVHEIEESLIAASFALSPEDAAEEATEESHLASVRAAPDCATPLGSQSGVPFLRGRRL
jgi:hypothetical protein